MGIWDIITSECYDAWFDELADNEVYAVYLEKIGGKDKRDGIYPYQQT